MDSLIDSQFRQVSQHGIAEVRQRLSNGQQALFASKAFNEGETISLFSAGIISPAPTYLTVQIDLEKHITLQPEFLQYINHSCAPNAFFDTRSMQLIALKNIRVNEEITFFYPSTEWEMAQPFHCFCGRSQCLGEIKGAAFVAENILKQYRLTHFIQQQLAKRSTRKVRA